MDTTLVIMAAGIGSRYGAGVKQLAPVGPEGQIIMDYSIHDAIAAGFNKIIFIIREDIKDDFMEVIGKRIEKVCAAHDVEVAYTYQEINDIPELAHFPEGRTKPWGTGQAVLSARELIHEPFCTINADDYYGRSAFKKVHDYLINMTEDAPTEFCMAGFLLKNTLSDNGVVTRGITEVDSDEMLVAIHETHGISKSADGDAVVDGQVLAPDSHVSMNMWGFTPYFLDLLDTGWKEFFETLKLSEDADPMKDEYLIPVYIEDLLERGVVSVKVLETTDTWFGVTYQADREYVADAFHRLTDMGIYRKDLFSDL